MTTGTLKIELQAINLFNINDLRFWTGLCFVYQRRKQRFLPASSAKWSMGQGCSCIAGSWIKASVACFIRGKSGNKGNTRQTGKKPVSYVLQLFIYTCSGYGIYPDAVQEMNGSNFGQRDPY